MSDDDIRKAYKALGLAGDMSSHQIAQARTFIAALFDSMVPAGFVAGTEFAEEEWMLTDPTPLYRKP